MILAMQTGCIRERRNISYELDKKWGYVFVKRYDCFVCHYDFKWFEYVFITYRLIFLYKHIVVKWSTESGKENSTFADKVYVEHYNQGIKSTMCPCDHSVYCRNCNCETKHIRLECIMVPNMKWYNLFIIYGNCAMLWCNCTEWIAHISYVSAYNMPPPLSPRQQFATANADG